MYFEQDNCELIFKQRDTFAGFHNIDQTRVFFLDAHIQWLISHSLNQVRRTYHQISCLGYKFPTVFVYIYGGVTGL